MSLNTSGRLVSTSLPGYVQEFLALAVTPTFSHLKAVIPWQTTKCGPGLWGRRILLSLPIIWFGRQPFLLENVLSRGQIGSLVSSNRSYNHCLLQPGWATCQVTGKRGQLVWSLYSTMKGGLADPLDVIVPLVEYLLPFYDLESLCKSKCFSRSLESPLSLALYWKDKASFHHSRAT